MNNKQTIYLSGPILGCPENVYKEWRERVVLELSGYEFEFIDPTNIIYEKEADHADEVVQATTIGVSQSDIILAYIPFYSMGTSFEVFLGSLLKKQIIIACEVEYESAFIRKFADHIFYQLDDAIEFLKGK